ncbi:hypothetical protein DFJ74DRAFT_356652 [Hyaloraphidium curvatum]|nr:hypothetical protein DFJ74DRAFT_356652 [Hyaloraphidium curvatum]
MSGKTAVLRVVGVVPAGAPGLANAADTLQWSRARRRRPRRDSDDERTAVAKDEDASEGGYSWDDLVRRADEWRAEREAAARGGREADDDDAFSAPGRMVLANGVSVPGGGPTILEFLFTAMPRGAGADAVAQRPPDLPRGPAPLPGPPDVLPRAMAAFWTPLHVLVPLIHRTAFESAIRSSNGVVTGVAASIYRTPPLALMYAIAANGVRLVPTLDAHQRLAYAAACFERTRDLLLSRGRDDLESAQAIFLLMGLLYLAGAPGKTLPLLRRCVATAQALYLGLPTKRPSSAGEWLARDHVLRLRICVAWMDYATAYNTPGGTHAQGSYFYPHRLELPRSEAFYCHADPEEAFSMLQQMHPDPEVVEIPAHHGWDAAKAICHDLARAPFGGNASIMCLTMAFAFVRHIAVASRGTNNDTRMAALAMPALVDAMWSAFPADQLTSLRSGDPGPFLDHSNEWFPHPYHGFMAISALFFTEEHAFMSLSDGGFWSAAATRALRFASILKILLDRDPHLDSIAFFVLGPIFRAGTVLLSAVKSSGAALPGETSSEKAERKRRLRELRTGAQAVARALHGLNEIYGMAARQVDAAFARMMAEAGLSEASSSAIEVLSELASGAAESIIMDEEVPDKESAMWFADILMRDESAKSSSVVSR